MSIRAVNTPYADIHINILFVANGAPKFNAIVDVPVGKNIQVEPIVLKISLRPIDARCFWQYFCDVDFADDLFQRRFVNEYGLFLARTSWQERKSQSAGWYRNGCAFYRQIRLVVGFPIGIGEQFCINKRLV